MVSFLRAYVLAACQQYGPQLKVPAGLDGVKLMQAIATVESSFGVNCGPRHEPGYDVGGSVWRHSQAQQDLVRLYPSPPDSAVPESPAAMSYGPWQTMLVNCRSNSPEAMNTDLDACASVFVSEFNSYVIGVCKAASLDEIGECWNAGHITPDPAYTAKLEAAYSAAG